MIQLSQKIVYQMRQQVFNRLTELPVGYFDTHQTGDIVSRISYDIDTVSMTLRIRGTKSKTSDRVMPISKPLEYVINRVITSADPYLFHVTGDYVSRAFKALCPNHKLHDLRHTFATHCLQCGVSMKVLQLWLGHASFETTASIYTHVVDAFQRTEASKIAWF